MSKKEELQQTCQNLREAIEAGAITEEMANDILSKKSL